MRTGTKISEQHFVTEQGIPSSLISVAAAVL
jgi:hypothetical protein